MSTPCAIHAVVNALPAIFGRWFVPPEVTTRLVTPGNAENSISCHFDEKLNTSIQPGCIIGLSLLMGPDVSGFSAGSVAVADTLELPGSLTCIL
ncbi:MAG TPA: hypothetical protein VG672_26340, partial [Bryobacteraceae bacterium]|nr:hypothetical protein [Bryobacteraceae bacterium]